jgi:hypothetical protein
MLVLTRKIQTLARVIERLTLVKRVLVINRMDQIAGLLVSQVMVIVVVGCHGGRRQDTQSAHVQYLIYPTRGRGRLWVTSTCMPHDACQSIDSQGPVGVQTINDNLHVKRLIEWCDCPRAAC